MFYIFIKHFFLFLLLLLLFSFLSFFILSSFFSFIQLVGESSKQGIQVAWSTPIHHITRWRSPFRGVYRTLTASEGELFLTLLKGFWSLCYVTRSFALVVVGVLYLPLHFIIFVIIITFIANIFFIIFIITRIFIKSSLLFLWGKLTVWFCFFHFIHLS